MKSKKYIKLKADMYEDTKFKIIDTMENRDTINYIWTRILALCGKINNDEGALIISKNIIYTMDILALEFNRTKEQVENAINVFIDLNMMCRNEEGVLSVCNWNKHQGKSRKKQDNKKEEESDVNNKAGISTIGTDLLDFNSKEECNKVNQNELKEIKSNLNDSMSESIKFTGKVKELNKESVNKKSYKRKNKKQTIEEIVVVDENNDEEDYNISAVDLESCDYGRVVANFVMT